MTSTNFWLNKSVSKDELKRLDDFLMEAWSNDATVHDMLNNMPADIKSFFLQLKIGCPNPIPDGIQITFDL